MATVEHCLYCFDQLVSKLQNRTPLALSTIEDSWSNYPKGIEDSDSEGEDENEANEADPRSSRAAVAATSAGTSNTTLASSSASAPSTQSTTPLSTAPPSRPPTSASNPGPVPEETPYTPIGQSTSRLYRSSSPLTENPLFVTWNILSPTSHSRSLRGCIGTFEFEPLATGLATYALTAALHDTRFNPIAMSELPRLEVAVTLLTDFVVCSEPLDWSLGEHGIKISFYHRHRRYSATYLPDVAVEQGWTKEETLESLVRKAGWSGKKGWREVGEIRVVRYQGRKESVEYEEYRRWREWFGERQ